MFIRQNLRIGLQLFIICQILVKLWDAKTFSKLDTMTGFCFSPFSKTLLINANNVFGFFPDNSTLYIFCIIFIKKKFFPFKSVTMWNCTRFWQTNLTLDVKYVFGGRRNRNIFSLLVGGCLFILSDSTTVTQLILLTSDGGFMTASSIISSLLPHIAWKMKKELKVENMRSHRQN